MTHDAIARRLSRDPDFGEKLVRMPGWESHVKTVLEDYEATSGDAFSIRHTIQVTSYGGSGTTALCRHFDEGGLDLPKSPDYWPFKHTLVPPSAEEVPKHFRVVYVYGDPRDAVVSLFRRGLQVGMFRVIHGDEPPPEAERRLATLGAYARAGIDDLGLQRHFTNWLGHPPGYPVLFLNFDSLPESWPAVRDFVGLPADYPCLTVRPRRSSVTSVEGGTVATLTAMYEGLLERIAELPPVHIIE